MANFADVQGEVRELGSEDEEVGRDNYECASVV